MNINNINSYALNLFSWEFHGVRQENVQGDESLKEIMTDNLHEFRLNIRLQTVDYLVQQSSIVNPGNFFHPDLSGLSFFEESAGGLSHNDSESLTGEDGFFGVSKTAARIAEFVLSGSGENIEKLEAGREGVLKGFKEAEQLWGGELPEISYDTIEKALFEIDQRIDELGGSIVSYRV